MATITITKDRSGNELGIIDVSGGSGPVSIEGANGRSSESTLTLIKSGNDTNSATVTPSRGTIAGQATLVISAARTAYKIRPQASDYRVESITPGVTVADVDPGSEIDAVTQALADHAATSVAHGKLNPLADTVDVAAAVEEADEAAVVTVATALVTHDAALSTQTALSSPFLDRSQLPMPAAMTADTIYWLYMGQMDHAGSVEAIQWATCVAAVGTQAGEVAVAKTGSAPNPSGNADITVSAEGAAAIVGDQTVAGYFSEGPSAGFAIGDHVWLGIRFNFTGIDATQPRLSSVFGDFGRGYIQTTAAAGVIGEGVYAGTVPTPTIGGGALVLSGPDLTCKVHA